MCRRYESDSDDDSECDDEMPSLVPRRLLDDDSDDEVPDLSSGDEFSDDSDSGSDSDDDVPVRPPFQERMSGLRAVVDSPMFAPRLRGGGGDSDEDEEAARPANRQRSQQLPQARGNTPPTLPLLQRKSLTTTMTMLLIATAVRMLILTAQRIRKAMAPTVKMRILAKELTIRQTVRMKKTPTGTATGNTWLIHHSVPGSPRNLPLLRLLLQQTRMAVMATRQTRMFPRTSSLLYWLTYWRA